MCVVPAGSVTVQQQALQVAVRPEHVQRLNRKTGRVWGPKVGWVRFRMGRYVPRWFGTLFWIIGVFALFVAALGIVWTTAPGWSPTSRSRWCC